MADRELTLKLGTELKGGGDEALRKIGRAALDAKRDTDALGSSWHDTLKKSIDASRALEEQLKKTFGTGARELDALNAKLGKFDKQFRDVAKQGLSGNLVGVASDRLNVAQRDGFNPEALMGQAAGMLGIPTSVASLAGAFAALAVTVKAADSALRTYKDSFYRGQFHEGKFADNLYEKATSILPQSAKGAIDESANRVKFQAGTNLLLRTQDPLSVLQDFNAVATGEAPGATREDVTPFAIRREELAASLEALKNSSAMAGIHGAAYRKRLPLQAEEAELAGQRQFGLASVKDAFAAEQGYRAAVAKAFGTAGHTLGYTREAEMGDVRFRAQHAAALQAHAAETKRVQGIQTARLTHARGAEKTQAQEVAEQQRQVSRARETLGKADSTESETKARLALEQQLVRLKEEQGRLEEASQRRLHEERQALQENLSLEQQKANLLRQQSDALARQREQEKERVRGQRESMGLLHPMDVRTALGIARKHNAGMPLTQREIGYMQQHSDVFGEQVRQIGAQRYNANDAMGQMLRELTQRTGAGSKARLQALDKEQLKVDAQMKVAVEFGSTEELMKQLGPALTQLQEQIKAQTQQQIQRFQNQLWLQRQATLGS